MDTDGTVPSNIVINGVEYNPQEAQELIETGKTARELEEKWNVKFDTVWPEYGKTREALKTTEAERDALKAQIAQVQAKADAGVETPADMKAAREAAKKLGIVLDDDIKGKYLTREELDNWYSEKKQLESATDAVLAEAGQLSKELNGEDGRPKFITKHVLAYAQAYGMTDLKQAYEDMHAEELKGWKDAQIAAQRGKSLRTLKGGTAKTPVEPRMTNDNVREALHEALTQGQ